MAYKSVGYAQITSLSSVKGLADAVVGTNPAGIPASSGTVLIQAESQDVRWRDDGTNPTASVGMLLKANDSLLYDFDLTRIKFIEATASAKLNITFYGSP